LFLRARRVLRGEKNENCDSYQHSVLYHLTEGGFCGPDRLACGNAVITRRVLGDKVKKGTMAMDFYTTVLRRSGPYWVVLCLENGIVAQGYTKDIAIGKLREAISSIEVVRKDEKDIFSEPLSIKELHEFLTVEGIEELSEPLEMRALYA
jgi:hypothetical protein